MKGKFKKIAAAFVAVTVLVGSMPSIMFAAAGGGNDYTALAGSTTKFSKILVVEKTAKVPPVTFNYTIEAGTAIDSSDYAHLDVNAGISPSNVVINSVAFSSTDTPPDRDSVNTNALTDNTTYYSVTKDVNVDFSGVNFTEPGVYRYIITETNADGSGYANDVNPESSSFSDRTSTQTRTLDVYVEDNGSGVLQITDYVMYTGTITAAAPVPTTPSVDSTAFTSGNAVNTASTNTDAAQNLGTKIDNYINKYSTHDLTIAKEVEGNQGSKDKYFKFTVVFTGAVDGTVYDVDISHAQASPVANAATTYDSMSNPTSITINGETTATFYLQDGQSVVIKGIADGTQYSVEEDEEDYSPALLVTGDTDGTATNDGTPAALTSGSGAADKYADTGITNNASLTFTNTRSGVLPTGIIMSVAPAAVVGLGVLAAIIAMVVAGKKRAAEEE